MKKSSNEEDIVEILNNRKSIFVDYGIRSAPELLFEIELPYIYAIKDNVRTKAALFNEAIEFLIRNRIITIYHSNYTEVRQIQKNNSDFLFFRIYEGYSSGIVICTNKTGSIFSTGKSCSDALKRVKDKIYKRLAGDK